MAMTPATDAGMVVVRGGIRLRMIAGLATGEMTIGETGTAATAIGETPTGETIVPLGGVTTAIDTTSSDAFKDGETETLTDTAFLETGVEALPEIGVGAGIRGLARSAFCQS
ncbi:MAG TPA: hypothetical protein VKB46_06565 [Pyrinomonadaceae bacterium]|nr:hypothetical protein [Pyrinomonadaceae bacterium]